MTEAETRRAKSQLGPQYDPSQVTAFLDILDATASRVLDQIATVETGYITPAIYTTARQSRRSDRIDELKRLGTTYESQAAVLAALEEKLAKQRRLLERMSADHLNAICPIGSLPVEILHRIFMLASDGSPGPLKGSPLKARRDFSLVCKFWSSAMASLRTMWDDTMVRADDLDSATVHLRRATARASLSIYNPTIPHWITDTSLRAKINKLAIANHSPLSTLDFILAVKPLPNLQQLLLKGTVPRSKDNVDQFSVDLLLRRMNKLRRLSLSNIDFVRLEEQYGCDHVLHTFDLLSCSFYPPYLFRALNSLKSLNHLRIVKATDAEIHEDMNDEMFEDARIPKNLRILTLTQCDWTFTEKCLNNLSVGAQLEELRLSFMPFESEPNWANDNAGVPLLTLAEETDLSESAEACQAFIWAIDDLKKLKLLTLSGPNTLLIRIVQAMTPHSPESTVAHETDQIPESDEPPLPSLRHFELKLTNGSACDPLPGLGGARAKYHCHCVMARSGFDQDLKNFLQHRVADKMRLAVLKVSLCTVSNVKAITELADEVDWFKCKCLTGHSASFDFELPPPPPGVSGDGPVPAIPFPLGLGMMGTTNGHVELNNGHVHSYASTGPGGDVNGGPQGTVDPMGFFVDLMMGGLFAPPGGT